MRRTFGIALTLGVAFFLSCLTASADSIKIPKIIVHQMTKQQFLDMTSLGLDILEAKDGQFELLAHPGDLEKLDHLGIAYQVDQPDMVSYYAQRSAATFGGFRTYSEILAFLDSLTAANPSIVSVRYSIGQTVEGRDQWVIKISNNPNIDENKPEIFYNSLIHAREPASADCLLNFMKYLVQNYGVDPNVTSVVNSREMFFLPVINPDGYVYNETTNPSGGGLWRKNRRLVTGTTYGVDLNRNFGFTWGYDDIGSSSQPSSETYRGASAFSEIETTNLKNFVISRHFSIIHNLHTYSNLVLWPWAHDRWYTDRQDFYKNLGDSLTKDNHYTPNVSWTLYPTNGDADDWAWGDTISKPRTISLTTEIGNSTDGFWPAVSRIPTLESENVQTELFLAKIADNPYLLAPPTQPAPHVADSSTPNFDVTWHLVDTINPAVGYSLYELTNKTTVTDNAEIDNGYWTTARMALSSARKHGGTNSWKTQNANGVNHWLVSKTPYLVKSSDSLKFWTWYDVESNWDYFYAQVSVDGGNTFVNLANNLTTNTNPNKLNLGNGITGQSGTWVRAAFDLAPYVGTQVILRLTLFTDSYTLGEGVYIDDIENIDMFGATNLVASGITDTLYHFSSKPLGTYYYRVTATDAQNQVSRLSDIARTTVYQTYMVGDITGDNTINLADLSALVAYLTTGVPVPNPLARGNLNCTGSVDLADLSYMVAFLTAGLTLPHCP